jgi:hypothetical protein
MHYGLYSVHPRRSEGELPGGVASRRPGTVLGPERFVKKIAKETVPPPISRGVSLKDLLKRVAAKSGVPADMLLRKGRLANVVQTRDRFIREAVLEQGYLASQVADFLACHPSNVSRALQKS